MSKYHGFILFKGKENYERDERSFIFWVYDLDKVNVLNNDTGKLLKSSNELKRKIMENFCIYCDKIRPDRNRTSEFDHSLLGGPLGN